MRQGYIAVGVIAAITLCWCGWQSLTPTTESRKLPAVEVHEEPKPPREFASRPEPPEVIDLSSIFEPVSDEDRVPSLSELELVGYYKEAAKPVELSWLEKLFKSATASETPAIWEFKGGPEFPGGTGSTTPTMEVRPGDLPSKAGKPRIE